MSILRSSISLSLRAPMRAAMAQRMAVRSMATTPVRFSEHHAPVIQGAGPKPGEIGTDEQQSTGLERFELMGRLEGIDVFDMSPLDASRPGTMKDPIVVQSLAKQLVVGSTGYPAESHETVWLTLDVEKPIARCPISGQVYKLEYIGPSDEEGHHH